MHFLGMCSVRMAQQKFFCCTLAIAFLSIARCQTSLRGVNLTADNDVSGNDTSQNASTNASVHLYQFASAALNGTSWSENASLTSASLSSSGCTLHFVHSCQMCGINFCDNQIWVKDGADVERGCAMGSQISSWGCGNVVAPPVLRNSATGYIYVLDESSRTLHFVATCYMCGYNFCLSTLWQRNVPAVEAGYTPGAPLSTWGCANAQRAQQVVGSIVHNSVTGNIYVAEGFTNSPSPSPSPSWFFR